MIVHVMKDGSVIPDIAGHVVKVKDAQRAYEIMLSMKKERK